MGVSLPNAPISRLNLFWADCVCPMVSLNTDTKSRVTIVDLTCEKLFARIFENEITFKYEESPVDELKPKTGTFRTLHSNFCKLCKPKSFNFGKLWKTLKNLCKPDNIHQLFCLQDQLACYISANSNSSPLPSRFISVQVSCLQMTPMKLYSSLSLNQFIDTISC